MRSDGRHCLFDFQGIAGVDDHQVGHGAENCQVIGGLMAGPVTGGEAGQAADDFDVEVFFGDGHADEVIGTTRSEHRIGGGERHKPLTGHPGGRAHQQLLGHAHLVKTLRVRLGENMQVGVFGQVRRQPDDVRTLISEGRQCVAERR